MAIVDIFEKLKSEDYAIKVAEHLLGLNAKEDSANRVDPLFAKYYEKFSSGLSIGNIKRIYRYCESPIETAFFAALQMNFICISPTMFRIERAPDTDYLEVMRQRIRLSERSFQSFLFYQNLPSEARPTYYGDFLRYWINDPSSGMTEEGVEWLENQALFELQLGHYHAIHVVLQPRFDNLYAGKNVRADAMIWVPSNPSVKIIIECDGFEYHGPKDAFISDRKRDRAFSEKGWSVRRFSGSEIYVDVLGVTELFSKQLSNTIEYGHDWSAKWERRFARKSKHSITPSPAAIESWKTIAAERGYGA